MLRILSTLDSLQELTLTAAPHWLQKSNACTNLLSGSLLLMQGPAAQQLHEKEVQTWP